MQTNHWPAGTPLPRLGSSLLHWSKAVLPNREGQRGPQVTFRARNETDWKPLTTDDVFKGKTVVVFSLPGAFTPTCSSTHVPRYNELAPAFFANGVDRIVCLSVNDAFVMNEWARTQECGNLLLLPDGNGEFTERSEEHTSELPPPH